MLICDQRLSTPNIRCGKIQKGHRAKWKSQHVQEHGRLVFACCCPLSRVEWRRHQKSTWPNRASQLRRTENVVTGVQRHVHAIVGWELHIQHLPWRRPTVHQSVHNQCIVSSQSTSHDISEHHAVPQPRETHCMVRAVQWLQDQADSGVCALTH